MVLDVNAPLQDAILQAAEELFYARGVQAVGIDEVRDRAGVSLKRLYGLYGSKDALLLAVLERRDVRWRGRLADHVAAAAGDPPERLLAVFDWFEQWFSEPGFRGCAWINSFGELGGVNDAVVEQARLHKQRFAQFVGQLAEAAQLDADTLAAVLLLAEGAIVQASITGSPAWAGRARAAAARLLDQQPTRLLDRQPTRLLDR